MAEPLSEAEFDDWIKPSVAIDMFADKWSFETTARTISTRLEAGMIRASAGSARQRVATGYRNQQKELTHVVAIPASHWVWWACLAAYDFWTTGDVTLYENGNFLGDFFDVRFDPQGIAALLPTPKAAETKEPEKPNVSKTELARWHEVFKGVHPSASEALALQSAAAMFPDKNVPRQFVRDLRGPQPLGKPKSRRQ